MYTSLAVLFFLTACKQNQSEQVSATDTVVTAPPAGPAVAEQNETQTGEPQCAASEQLLYEDAGFSSYTEDKIRGEGVVSFTLDINDRLTILNMDGSAFGEIVLNEDMTYFTLNMPQKTTARSLVTNFDFAAFDFDAENTNTDKEYLIIYVNKEKRKVKKSDLKFMYNKWNDYLKNSDIALKDCNLLKDANGKQIPASKGQAFVITEVKADMVNIKSSKDCTPDGVAYKPMQGWVKWKSDKGLLLNFTSCN